MLQASPVRLRAACLQVTATPDAEFNLQQAEKRVREAAIAGAQFLALPEAFDFLSPSPDALRAHARKESDHPALLLIRALAVELGVWILAGSVSALDEQGYPVNRSVLYASDGRRVASYDKIHMFDVDLPDDVSWRESNLYRRGERAVVAATPWANTGLSICYDVRFPHLYRRLARHGARIIMVPAAFSPFTGPLHWHTLLRARAIETGSFVVAPAQCGRNYEGRSSYGHSLVVDPWGEVLADGGDAAGIVLADLDLAKVDQFRAAIPSWNHEPEFFGPEQPA